MIVRGCESIFFNVINILRTKYLEKKSEILNLHRPQILLAFPVELFISAKKNL
jgi:hypothetical protein